MILFTNELPWLFLSTKVLVKVFHAFHLNGGRM
jgi:hypothetical protein